MSEQALTLLCVVSICTTIAFVTICVTAYNLITDHWRRRDYKEATRLSALTDTKEE